MGLALSDPAGPPGAGPPHLRGDQEPGHRAGGVPGHRLLAPVSDPQSADPLRLRPVRAPDPAALLPEHPEPDVPPAAGGAARRGAPRPADTTGRHHARAIWSAAPSPGAAGRRPAEPRSLRCP